MKILQDLKNLEEISPPLANGILLTHIGVKGFQLGSIVGTFVGPLYLKFWKKEALNVTKIGRFAWKASGIFTVLSLLGGLYRMSSLETVGIQDRAYRLIHNESQIRTDKFSLFGGILALALGRNAFPLGVTLGIGVHVATYTIPQHFENQKRKIQIQRRT